MLFNELIEQEGLENVFSKTNISTENLNRLFNEEFDKLNRVKALGFLLILEREYPDIDVSELRQKIKLYYAEHGPVDDKVVMVPASSTTGGGFSFFKLFIIATILGGSYYLYTQGKLNPLLNQVEDKKEFFDDSRALETNVTESEAQKVIVEKSKTESVHIETPVAPKIETVALSEEKSNNTKEEKEGDGSTKKEALVKTSSKLTKTKETNKSVASIIQEVSENFLAHEANKTVEETQNSTETITPIKTITINPTRGMLWYGFINLDTKKRREFMKKVSTPFTIGDGRWLLVTGHGYFDIISDTKTVENADNKKHYFLIDSRDIKEISRKEFRELNGHRGW